MRIEPDQIQIDYEDIKNNLYNYEGSPISKQTKVSNFNKLNPIKLRSMSSDVDWIEPETPIANILEMNFSVPDDSCHASDLTEYSSFSQHLKGILIIITHRNDWEKA